MNILLFFLFTYMVIILGQSPGTNYSKILHSMNETNQSKNIVGETISFTGKNVEPLNIPISLDVDNSSSKRRNGVGMQFINDSLFDDPNTTDTQTGITTTIHDNISSAIIMENAVTNKPQPTKVNTTNLDHGTTKSPLMTLMEIFLTTPFTITSPSNVTEKTVSNTDQNSSKLTNDVDGSDSNEVYDDTNSGENTDESAELTSSSEKPIGTGSSAAPENNFSFTTKQSQLHPKPVADMVDDKDKTLKINEIVQIEKPASSTAMHWALLVLATTVFICAVAAFIFYKRIYAGWQRRHYERVDFLIDGMYDDL